MLLLPIKAGMQRDGASKGAEDNWFSISCRDCISSIGA